MISALAIVFREMLEMVLVLGVLLAATRGMPETRRWIGAGAAIGLLGACIVAWFMEELENAMTGDGEFLFNAIVLSLASLFIAWTVIWMSQHGRQMSQRIKQIGTSVVEGELPLKALMFVSLAAVLREGSEAVFFLFGFLQAGQDAVGMFMGGLLGVFLGGLTGYLLYRGLVVIPIKQLFFVTGILLMLLAAGMASQAAWNLVVIDMIPPLVDSLWNTSSWLSQESFIGELLNVLIGYDENPSGMQLLVFVIALALMLLLDHYYRPEITEKRSTSSPVNS
ncbi:MAG: FTR1 family protein [Mariprofundaceae bacterium]|nr:FTR1 family protein [Mariprofundaceae bacterium]